MAGSSGNSVRERGAVGRAYLHAERSQGPPRSFGPIRLDFFQSCSEWLTLPMLAQLTPLAQSGRIHGEEYGL
jgi:hypothetical protein